MSAAPQHNTTRTDARDRGGPAQPLLLVEHLTKHFPIRGGLLNRQIATVQAVDDVSFSVRKGETLGIVGESGCGKSTTARLLMHLMQPDAGAIVFDGDQVGDKRGISVNDMRRQMQMVFQDSYSSLNPRMTMAESIAYAPRMHGLARKDAYDRAESLLSRVGLNPHQYARRYPHELSGGQRQRVNIARALVLEPRLVILDEAVAALDKSVEAQVLNLLGDLKESLNLTYLFISHDLNVVEYMSDRVMVMYLGRVVEAGPVESIYRHPRHPYTRALFASKPTLDPDRRTTEMPLTGDPPNPINPPSGCRFRTRCMFAQPRCAETVPSLAAPFEAASDPAHVVACHIPEAQSAMPHSAMSRSAVSPSALSSSAMPHSAITGHHA
jgi:peptide/nickel transport system ATP-binding protein